MELVSGSKAIRCFCFFWPSLPLPLAGGFILYVVCLQLAGALRTAWRTPAGLFSLSREGHERFSQRSRHWKLPLACASHHLKGTTAWCTHCCVCFLCNRWPLEGSSCPCSRLGPHPTRCLLGLVPWAPPTTLQQRQQVCRRSGAPLSQGVPPPSWEASSAACRRGRRLGQQCHQRMGPWVCTPSPAGHRCSSMTMRVGWGRLWVPMRVGQGLLWVPYQFWAPTPTSSRGTLGWRVR